MATELCKLGIKHIVDKCPDIYHTYTPLYYNIFKDIKNKIQTVLEIGIGTPEIMQYTNYKPGASLRMWRDFFTNATIYGADIVEKVLFEEDRIKTFKCDQSNKDSLENLYISIQAHSNKDKIDFIIDDGSHIESHMIISLVTLWPYIKENGGIYIIEDMHISIFNSIKNVAFKCCEDIEVLYEHYGKSDADCFIAFIKNNLMSWFSDMYPE